jgi:hypothetical protein
MSHKNEDTNENWSLIELRKRGKKKQAFKVIRKNKIAKSRGREIYNTACNFLITVRKKKRTLSFGRKFAVE